MKELAIFGQGVFADVENITRQRRLNCFYDIRVDQDKHATVVRNTPGSTLAYTLATSPIRGWLVVGSLLYIVAGAKLYSVNSSNTVTTLGSLGTSTGLVGMSDNAVQLLIVDGVAGYCYTIVTGSYAQAALNTAGAFAAITDGNFPNGATTTAFFDGRNIVERAGTRQYYCSQSYDVTGWTNSASLPTYATKDNYSDTLLTVDVLNGTLILSGGSSLEFWQDVGSSPLPFARVNGATQTVGLAAVNSRAAFNNTLAFLGKSKQGGVQVFTLNGYTPTRISTSDIEDLVSSFSTYSDAIALTYTSHGHPMYQLTFPTANRTLVYDGLTGFWNEAQTGLALLNRHFGNIGVVFNGINYLNDSTTGNVYKLDDRVFTDNGTYIKRQLVTRHVHTGGNMFNISELFLDMETGEGLQVGQGSDPQIMLQISRDNGHTFGVEKWASMGAVGLYRTRVIWRRLGAAEDFVFKFTITDPVQFAIIHAAAVIEQGEGLNG